MLGVGKGRAPQHTGGRQERQQPEGKSANAVHVSTWGFAEGLVGPVRFLSSL